MEDILIDAMVTEEIRKCFHVFGLEGTEDIINKNLSGEGKEVMKERFLRIYHELLKG